MLSMLCIVLTTQCAVYTAAPLRHTPETYSRSEEEYLQEIDTNLGWIIPENHTVFLRHRLVLARREKNTELQKINDEKNTELQKMREELKDAHNRTITAEKDRDEALNKAKMYIVPLTVRAYATMIEEEFPNAKGYVSPAEWKATPVHSRYLLARKMKFFNILNDGEKKENPYVQLIVHELDNYFRERFNMTEHDTIDRGSQRYKVFRLRFCDSIVKAIEYGNKVIAHAQAACAGRVEGPLGVYDNVVDKNMKVFYNAMVGSDLADKMKERIKLEYPDCDSSKVL